MKKFQILTAVLLVASVCFAGDSIYIKRITDTLASASFFGRGYLKDGMKNAGNFIASEMKRNGLNIAEQSFNYPVNIFPGKMMLTINGAELIPGKDFIIAQESKGCKCKGLLEKTDSVTWVNRESRVIIIMEDKLTWSVAPEQADYTMFKVLKTDIIPQNFSCEIVANEDKKFKCSNYIGTIKGTTKPDSVIVFTAHYDHLGGMGEATYFPGANDNAGGVALMLDIAAYFSAHPAPYSIQFMAFAGEEAGLIGSKYYVDHPLNDLKKIRFLVNLDLMGNGDEGVTVVNATEFATEFSLLKKLNESQQLLVAVNSRGKAANSDHYWFTEKNVPSFFIYTLGKRKAYHDIDDIAATVPWFEANDLGKLLVSFANALINNQ